MGNFYLLPLRWFWFHLFISVHLGSKSHRWIVSNFFLQLFLPFLGIYISILVSLILIYYPWIPTILGLCNFLSTGLNLIYCWLTWGDKNPPNMPRTLICSLQLLIPLFLNLLLHTRNTCLEMLKGLKSSQIQWFWNTSQYLPLHVKLSYLCKIKLLCFTNGSLIEGYIATALIDTIVTFSFFHSNFSQHSFTCYDWVIM